MRHNSEAQQSFDFKKSHEMAMQAPAVPESDFVFQSPEGYEIYLKEKSENATLPDADTLRHYHQLYPLLAQYYLNPLTSLVNSKTMLLPHQVQAAHHIVSSSRPRFLIADEVGLGKTIEAGLIIKELMLKHDYERILICVPAPLIYQWQAELKSKFNEDFTVIRGKEIKKPGLLENEKKVLVSIDLAKDHKEKFVKHRYDVVVFDEAHRLRREVAKITRAYQFAETIIDQAVPDNGAVLLLSATPFRGKLEEIYYLISLLDKDVLGPVHSFLNRYQDEEATDLRERLQPVVIRRRKIDVGGFTKRFAKTVKINLSPSEAAFYQATNEYVMREYNLALKDERNMKSFVMIVFQKILDSSCYALLQALKRRKDRLEQKFNNLMRGDFGKRQEGELDELDPDEIDDFDFDDTTMLVNPQEIRQEIAALNRLIIMGSRLNRDSKFDVCKNTIDEMFSRGHKKIIIFTQFKNTLEYIGEKLSKSFSVSLFHGGLSAQEKEDAIEVFWQERQILICTEAGGEGRNLQVASALLNYDLPWSPLKVEQRIGRIHRFGQKKDVHIVNFACKDTVAERVIDILEKKIRLFESALGPSDSLLGTLEEEKKFSRSIFNFLKKRKSKKENEIELQSAMRLAKDNAAKIDQLVSTEFLDFNTSAFGLEREKSAASEKQLEAIVAHHHNGLLKKKDSYLFEDGGLQKKGTFSYNQASNSESLEFLALGHGLVDQTIEEIMNAAEGEPAFWVHSTTSKGFLCHFKIQIELEKTYRRFYSVFYDAQTQQVSINQANHGAYSHLQVLEMSARQIKSHLEIIWPEFVGQLSNEINKISERVKSSLSFWRGQVAWANQQRNQELDEKLEIQRGKLKWYKSANMSAVITRTLNKKKKQNASSATKLNKMQKALSGAIKVHLNHITFFSEIKGEKFS